MKTAGSPRTPDDRPLPHWNRRDALRLAASGVVASVTANESVASIRPASRAAKRVVVAGAGIGGLCCAYELIERGHDVTVLEASGRPGGHVKTIHDPLPDGLYADVGAEHFTRPGYEQYWKYVEKFGLPFVAYPRRIHMLRRIDGTWYTEAQLQDPKVLRSFGFNPKEVDFIVRRGWTELPLLYFGPYLDAIGDEYQPFGAGLDQLDEITAGELLAKDGASDAAIRFNGLRRGDGSQAAPQRRGLGPVPPLAVGDRQAPRSSRLQARSLQAQGRKPAHDRHVRREARRAGPLRLPDHLDRARGLRGDRPLPRIRRAREARGRVPRMLDPARDS